MEKSGELETIFERLSVIMRQYEGELVVKAREAGNYYLETSTVAQNKKPMFFGSVQVKKNQVSYHLMPVYVFPELLEGISEKLAKRMQGKSCFNFKSVDEGTFEELAGLTEKSFEQFKQAGYVKELPEAGAVS